MENTRHTIKEKIEAVGMLRESNYNFAAIAEMLNVPVGTIHRWNDKHGPTVKDALQECTDPVTVVEDTCQVVHDTNSSFIKKVNYVRNLALDRLALVIPIETDAKKLVDAIRALNEITNEIQPKDQAKGNYFLQIIEKQYISKHGNKISQHTDTGDTA
jgi:transposase-like protein